MNYKFINPKGGEKEGYLLIVHKGKKFISKKEVEDFVKEKLKQFFEWKNCKTVYVDRVATEDMQREICGCRYHQIFFETGEYTNDEIWYPMSRFRPEL